ncbi:MAG: ribosome biogenesis GTPase Der [Alphaproteobacteria bacterium]
MTLLVAIVGRPNVGKSTLFNRLAGRRLAIVHDLPGVTRDRREAPASLGGIDFSIIDTAGLDEALPDSLEARMRAQTELAVNEADVVLMLIDARAGVTPLDRHFAAGLRRGRTPVILVANKCEGREATQGLYECYSLGLGDPVPISAEHNEGMAGLVEALLPYAEAAEASLPADAWEGGEGEEKGDEKEEDGGAPMQLAIVGRPNVGKSTLVNRLLGEERMLTGPEAGITRDAITTPWEYRGRRIRLVDTAGIRRRSRVVTSLERLSVADSLHAVDLAQVVVLVLDANAVLDKQDLTIARKVVDEGRALVVAVNKWDVAEDRAAALERLNDRLATSLPQVQGVPTVTLSALTGQGMDRLMGEVLKIHDLWKRRIPTAALNRWLESVLSHHPPPMGRHGRRIRLRYMTQIKSRPPTFVIFTSLPEDLPDSYVRYMMNGIRKDFDLPGVPLRLHLRGHDNPYHEK